MEVIGAIISIFIALLSIFYAYFKYSYNYWKSKGVSCDEPSIPFGNVKEIGRTLYMGEFLKNLYDKYKPTGVKLCGAYLFHRPIAILLDLELIKNVLVRDFSNFDERGVRTFEFLDFIYKILLLFPRFKFSLIFPKRFLLQRKGRSTFGPSARVERRKMAPIACQAHVNIYIG